MSRRVGFGYFARLGGIIIQSFGTDEVGATCQACPSTGHPGSPAPNHDEEENGHFIEIELVDQDTGEPASREEYCITLPDGVTTHGFLDANGFVHIGGIEQAGSCKIGFPKLDGKAWNSA